MSEKELQKQQQASQEVKQEAVHGFPGGGRPQTQGRTYQPHAGFCRKDQSDIIANARKESENIIQEAELKAKRAIQEAKQYLNVLEHQYLHIKEQKRQFCSSSEWNCRPLWTGLAKTRWLTKEPEQALDKEFHQIKDEMVPK